MTSRELPKSAILAEKDEVRRMFLAVRSLWTIGVFMPWRYTSPLHVSVRMDSFTGRRMFGAHSKRISTLISSRSITSTVSEVPLGNKVPGTG